MATLSLEGRHLEELLQNLKIPHPPSPHSQLTTAKLIKILQRALSIANHHHDKPQLVSELIYNISSALSHCVEADRDPEEILDCYICSEQIIVNGWNPFYPSVRLSGHLISNSHSADHRLSDLDNFPIRYAALTMGITLGRSLLPNDASRNGTKIVKPQPTSIEPEPTRESRRRRPKQVVSAVRRARVCTNGFLRGAPSVDIRFPNTIPANITIAEIICFFPQWLKSADVVDRAISNGGTPSTITRILKAHRDMPEGTSLASTISNTMLHSMRRRGGAYEDWTIATHKPPRDHSNTNISVAGFRTAHEDAIEPQSGVETILFRDLGKNISQFPSGFDALDLTRCVKYAMDPEHEHDNFIFPDQYEELVNVLGGPTAVCRENLDTPVFDRWNSRHVYFATRRRLREFHNAQVNFSNTSRKRTSEDVATDDALDESDCDSMVSEPTEQHPSSKRPRNS